jgi:ClpP class serine protease
MMHLTLLRQTLALSGAGAWAMHESGFSALASGVPTYDERAVAAAPGERLPGSRFARVVGDTAILAVRGALMQRWNYAYLSYDELREDIERALASPSVARILLSVQSPGGMVAGCDECAAAIAIAAGRKPMAAHIEGMGASAAYWLATAAGRVTAAPTAVAGSIGAILSYVDLTGILTRMGATDVTIASQQSPNKRHPAGSDAERAEYQPIIDSHAELFIRDVARARGVSRDEAIEGFGGGSIFTAVEAAARGMIDGVMTIEEALAGLSKETGAARQSSEKGPDAAAGRKVQGENRMNWSELTAAGLEQHRPDIAKAIREGAAASAEKAAADAVAAERTRIAAIRKASIDGDEAKITTAIEGGQSAADFAMAQIADHKARGGKLIEARIAADKNAAPPDAAAAPDRGGHDKSPAEIEASWDAAIAKNRAMKKGR